VAERGGRPALDQPQRCCEVELGLLQGREPEPVRKVRGSPRSLRQRLLRTQHPSERWLRSWQLGGSPACHRRRPAPGTGSATSAVKSTEFGNHCFECCCLRLQCSPLLDLSAHVGVRLDERFGSGHLSIERCDLGRQREVARCCSTTASASRSETSCWRVSLVPASSASSASIEMSSILDVEVQVKFNGRRLRTSGCSSQLPSGPRQCRSSNADTASGSGRGIADAPMPPR